MKNISVFSCRMPAETTTAGGDEVTVHIESSLRTTQPPHSSSAGVLPGHDTDKHGFDEALI